MRLRRASVIALSLLTSAATASGECAWVLWEERLTVSSQGGTKDWEIVATASEPKDCYSGAGRAATNQAERWRGPLTEVKIEGNQVTVSSKAGFVDNFRYLCLPDTVDPRGPKGK